MNPLFYFFDSLLIPEKIAEIENEFYYGDLRIGNKGFISIIGKEYDSINLDQGTKKIISDVDIDNNFKYSFKKYKFNDVLFDYALEISNEYWEKFISEYTSLRKATQEKEKAKIFSLFDNYLDIADTFSEKYKDPLTRIVKFYKVRFNNLINQLEEDVQQDNTVSAHLEPKKSNTVYNGIKDLRDKLIELNLIAQDTQITDLRGLFGFRELENKILWTGPICSLRHFIIQLEEKEIIVPLKHKKANILSKLFIIKNTPDFDFAKLKTYNSNYAGEKKLVDFVEKNL